MCLSYPRPRHCVVSLERSFEQVFFEGQARSRFLCLFSFLAERQYYAEEHFLDATQNATEALPTPPGGWLLCVSLGPCSLFPPHPRPATPNCTQKAHGRRQGETRRKQRPTERNGALDGRAGGVHAIASDPNLNPSQRSQRSPISSPCTRPHGPSVA